MKETSNESIKKEMLIGFLLFFITIGIFFITVGKNTFFKSIENVEKIDVEEKIEIVENEIDYRLNELTTDVASWAIWDDTYLFAQGLNENYREVNLSDDIFGLLDVDMIVLSDDSGKILYKKQRDFETKVVKEIEPAVSEAFIQSRILESKGLVPSFNDIMIIDGSPVLIGSHPILKGDSSGPAKGSVMFGRILNAEMVSEISEKLSLGVSTELIPKDEFDKVEDIDEQGIEIEAQNENYIVGSFYRADPFDEYYTKISVETPRNAMSIANNLYRITRITIPLILILTLFVLWYFIDKSILSRIIKLNTQVVEIKEEESLSGRVDVSKNDEISELSQGINGMLGSLEKLQNKIFNANKLLEKKVFERTKELKTTNDRLTVEITERKKLQEEATHLAHHDALTGLPNRLLLTDRLNQGIFRANREGTSISILFVDLDGFKTINDTLGHDQGDELLRQVSKRFLSIVRKKDTVSRCGGD